jgi:TonB family protein
MSKNFLTHLSTIIAIHLLLIFGGIKLLQQNNLSSTKALAPGILKVQLAAKLFAVPSFKSAPLQKNTAINNAKLKPLETASLEKVLSSQVSGPQTLTQEQVDAKAAFKAELRMEIEKNKYYPPISRRLGQTGTVVVAFTLLEDGHIIDVRLDGPSNFSQLNESALDAVRRVHKFRPIPSEWGEDKMDIRVPLKFLTI